MYPYDFVRMDWDKGVARRSAKPHNRFEGISGRLTGTITALTPIFIPENRGPTMRRTQYKHFLTNRQRHAIIPGSSLKGLIRGLVETIGPGCWWLFNGEYDDGHDGKISYWEKLPNDFHQCPDAEEKLCVACRMFGLIRGSTLLLGHVGFEDAVCEQIVKYDPLYTIILGSPKPRHTAFYLDEEGKLAGRKFYYHHSTPPVDKGKWLPDGAPLTRTAQNAYIQPLGAGSNFTFSAHFDNLAQDELRLLLYALALEPEMRHKIGYAKPAGLGSVQVSLTRLELIDYRQRYTRPDGGRTTYTDEALQRYVTEQIEPFVQDRTSITLQDLRRIWAWPGRDDLRYPSWEWFQDPENSAKRLNQTP
jgi:CRISPR/Cas system CSM-associated protein Csm3 (group 7 of RAMP superfamily)